MNPKVQPNSLLFILWCVSLHTHLSDEFKHGNMFCISFCITSQQRPCCVLPAEGSDDCINPQKWSHYTGYISQSVSLTAQGILLFISDHFKSPINTDKMEIRKHPHWEFQNSFHVSVALAEVHWLQHLDKKKMTVRLLRRTSLKDKEEWIGLPYWLFLQSWDGEFLKEIHLGIWLPLSQLVHVLL